VDASPPCRKSGPTPTTDLPVKHTKVTSLYDAIFFYLQSSRKTWASTTFVWTEAKIFSSSDRIRLPDRRLPPHKTRALLIRHDLSAYQDDFAAKSRTIVARKFVGLTNADAAIEIAARLYL
jgi:hypothetical protein